MFPKSECFGCGRALIMPSTLSVTDKHGKIWSSKVLWCHFCVRAERSKSIDFQKERLLRPGQLTVPGDQGLLTAHVDAQGGYTVKNGEHGLYKRDIQHQVADREWRNMDDDEICQIGDEVGAPPAHEVGPYEPFDPAKTTFEHFGKDFGTARRQIRSPREMSMLYGE